MSKTITATKPRTNRGTPATEPPCCAAALVKAAETVARLTLDEKRADDGCDQALADIHEQVFQLFPSVRQIAVVVEPMPGLAPVVIPIIGYIAELDGVPGLGWVTSEGGES